MRQQLGVCKVVGKELVNKAKLFITKLVPTLRRDEDNGDCRAKTRRAKGCLHIKSFNLLRKYSKALYMGNTRIYDFILGYWRGNRL